MDFLISEESKINAFEIKSSGAGKHQSIKQFSEKFSKNVNKIYLLSQKDVGKEENLLFKPFYSDALSNLINKKDWKLKKVGESSNLFYLVVSILMNMFNKAHNGGENGAKRSRRNR